MSRERDVPELVVGVGASAGGLEAFKVLLKALPADTGMAFLLVQHLDPNHDSLLAELLVPHTAMAVRDARQGEPLAADTIHVISPGCALAVRRGCIELSEPTLHRGVRLPVDHLFRSLAREYGSRSVGIVLSGAGSDGSSGLRDIKGAGGLTVAQDPDSGGQSGMPQSAIGTGLVDLVLAIEDMPAALARFAALPPTARVEPTCESPASNDEPDGEATLELDEKDLTRLTALLETRNDFDLRVYKTATVGRRVLRRMLLSGFDNIDVYMDHLRERLGEQQILMRDLLISVTSFFRDPEVFDTLDEIVLRPLIKQRKPGGEVRVWVAGCATGEEAYSIGMALLDAADALDKRIDLRIFATDVDQDALAVARAGIYPPSLAEHISARRLAEYFNPLEGRGYKVRSALRDRISFASHDLTKDPPFSRMDLVSCRNVMIYLTNEAQAHVLALLHFALKSEGHLLLSTSESTGSGRELFSTVSKPARLYRKVGNSRAVTVQRSRYRPPAETDEDVADRPPEARPAGRRRPVPDPARRAVLEACVPPTVVVAGDGAVALLHGELGPYLRFPQGDSPQLEFAEMLRPELATRIRSALYQCRRSGQVTIARSSPDDGRDARVRITARPAASLGDGAVVISFEETGEPDESLARGASRDVIEAAAGQETVIEQLEDELKATREDLRNTVEELESSNEELRSSNEESMSMNEELQSANEELEATTEELRSLNEELTTVNGQLREKVEQLEQAHDDLGNFFASARVSMIFLDDRLRIKRFTPAAAELLDIDSGDIGRFTGDIARELLQQGLEREARDVLDDLATKTEELRTGDGRWFSRRILPYRTENRRIEGVVVTLVDITELKRTSERLELRGQQQAVVARLGIDALHENDLERFLERAVREVRSTLDLDQCKILELQPGGHSLLLRVGLGWADGLVGHASVPAGSGSQAGYTLETREPVVVDDLATDTRFSGPELLVEHDVTSGLSCAVRDNGQRYGVLGGHTRHRRSFSREDATFFQAVANVIGSAVSRSQANAGAALERGAIRALVAHTDPDEALDDVLVRLVDAIGADIGELWWDEGEGLARRCLHVSHPLHDVDVARQLDGDPGGCGHAFLARVVESGRALWSTDLGDPPLFDDGPAANAIGLVSAIGLPVRLDERTLGAVTLYSRSRWFAGEGLLRTLERIGAVVGERVTRLLSEQRAARLAAITASSRDAIVGQDRDGHVTEWLPGAERLFGYEAAAMIGQSFERLVPPESRESARAVLSRVLAGESVEPFETVRLTGGGEHVEVSVRSSPIRDRDGRIVGVSSTERDITRLKETERRLLLADQQKNTFLAMLGHELRNPLSSIRTAAELLNDGDDTDRQHAQAALERQSAHMSRLLDGLLDVSRIISDKITLECATLDLAAVCRDVLADARERLEEKAFVLRATLPDEAVLVDADRVRLVQIVDNVLSNSIKFTPPGGTIAVTLDCTGSEARLEMTDSGVGIKAELLPHVFEIFRQSAQTPDRSAGGLGLGLALARSLVELHGGAIEAHSEGEGRGARFVVRLPLAVRAKRPAPPPGEAPSGPLDLLIVEDNVDSANLLRRVLTRSGHTVRVATSGREAMEEVVRHVPDVVLCDLGLPDGMSGHDVARALRTASATEGVRLVALTGYGRAEDRARSLEAGFDHHLTKPIGIDELKRALVATRSTKAPATS